MAQRKHANSGPGVVQRRSIRLDGYDYSSSGAYFITVCTAGSMVLFGRIADGRMVENRSARIVRNCWESLPGHYPRVSLDAFAVMPDHVHGIVVLGSAHRTIVERDRVARAGLKLAPTGWGSSTQSGVRHGLPEVVRAFKTFSARRINASRGKPGTAVWQRGYYEHVIRNERALKHIREYIRSNPQNWCKTPEHPNP